MFENCLLTSPIPVFPQTFYKAIDTSVEVGMGEANIPTFVSVIFFIPISANINF